MTDIAPYVRAFSDDPYWQGIGALNAILEDTNTETTMKTLNPRNTLVTIVEIKDADKKTRQGIIIPGSTGSEYKLCEVVQVGPGCNSDASRQEGLDDLSPGQTVLVKLHARGRNAQGIPGLAPIGLEYKDQSGRDLKLVEQTNIVAIVEDDGQVPILTDVEDGVPADVAGKVDGGSPIITD